MITLTLTDISTRTPQFIEHIKNGDFIRIMENGQTVADVLPGNSAKKHFDTVINRLAVEGKAIPPKHNTRLPKPRTMEEDSRIEWKSIYEDTKADRIEL
jgi:antitoxin (DNA-binding transcriptional repressor) of toxin-antitoxin stability system